MNRRIHLDANILLRFLRNDDPQQSPTAAELFKRAQSKHLHLIVSPVIVLEVFYVLTKTYAMPRPEAAKILDALITSGLVLCEDDGITVDALQRITSNKISFGDAYLVASAAHAQEELVSFDKGVAAFKDARLYPLNALSKK
ncbi:MAG TPA: PIN domain-containing protein [Verrucomicrobiae bacterium]|nr:PIN domain-containing protein [Verrucomicrobiae bacterium]